jgi:two-component sensor histidine kinase
MLSPIVLEGGRRLTLAVVRDITERRQAEAERLEAGRRAALLREVHHRVKNNLQVVSSMLSLQGDAMGDAAALGALAESQNRIASIALIHEKLYRSGELGRIDFGDYVGELCTNLFRAHGPAADRVRLELAVEPARFGLDTAVPCGLIVNELVSNALKHAFPDGRRGRVLLRLRAGEDACYHLDVEDDGVGLPPGLDPGATGTLGLQLVQLLTGQIDGRLEALRPDRGGARFHIAFREVVYRDRG